MDKIHRYRTLIVSTSLLLCFLNVSGWNAKSISPAKISTVKVLSHEDLDGTGQSDFIVVESLTDSNQQEPVVRKKCEKIREAEEICGTNRLAIYLDGSGSKQPVYKSDWVLLNKPIAYRLLYIQRKIDQTDVAVEVTIKGEDVYMWPFTIKKGTVDQLPPKLVGTLRKSGNNSTFNNKRRTGNTTLDVLINATLKYNNKPFEKMKSIKLWFHPLPFGHSEAVPVTIKDGRLAAKLTIEASSDFGELDIGVYDKPEEKWRLPDYAGSLELKLNRKMILVSQLELAENTFITAPIDNVEKPLPNKYETSEKSLFDSPVTLEWLPVEDATVYSYAIGKRFIDSNEGQKEVVRGETKSNRVTLSLPMNSDSEYYFIQLNALNEKRTKIGSLASWYEKSSNPGEFIFRIRKALKIN